MLAQLFFESKKRLTFLDNLVLFDFYSPGLSRSIEFDEFFCDNLIYIYGKFQVFLNPIKFFWVL